MGLDIAVFRTARITPPHDLDDDCWEEGHVMVGTPEGMEHALGGLEPGRCYLADRDHSFRAGSYTGYGHWRTDLAKTIHKVIPETIWHDEDAWVGKPFYELINFSDCEGTMGPGVCAKLYADFALHRDAYMAAHDPGDWCRESYDDWLEGFRVAATTKGLVLFT